MKRFALKALLFVAGGFGAALLYGLFGGTAAAHADVHILVGGNTDCNSQGMLNIKQTQGDYNPHDLYVPVSYGDCAGDFAPFLGGVTAPDAINQGVANTTAVWNQYCSNGQRCTVEGFSLGTASVSIVGTNVGADDIGANPNTHVITSGNAWGEPGLLSDTQDPLGQIEKGIANVFTGIPLDVPQVPGSENRFFTNDIWGNGAAQAPWAQITQAATINGDPITGLPQHATPDPTQPHSVYVTDDGVEQESYPGQGTYFGVVDPALVLPGHNDTDVGD